MNIGILDYGAGNLRSVINAFKAIGKEAHLVSQPQHLDTIDLLVFPGQGAFGDCVRHLHETGLWAPVRHWLQEKRPYIGICLGYQLLFENGEENPGVEGLGVFKGSVVRFQDAPGLKIPHMGWNSARFTRPESPIWQGFEGQETFYFVHSYFPEPQDASLSACVTDYGREFVSGIATDHLLAVQFHPEKSQQAGLKLLKNAVSVLLHGR